MFCRTCGNTVKEGAKFCPKCGTPALAAPKAEAAEEPKVVAPTSAVKGVKEKAPKAPKAPKVPLGVKEITKVRGISVVGIIMAFLSMGMLPLWWFSSPNGGGWDILGDGKFPLYLMFEMVEDLGLDSITEIIANTIVITAICLAAVAMVLYLLYIIFEFTKSKKPFCMVLASVISLMLIAVSATVAFGMTIVQIGDIGAVLDSLTGDFIGFFTDEAIMLSIPVGVLLVTSILGMCFAKYNKKVVTYAPAPTAPVAPVRPAAPKPAMPTAPTAPVKPAMPTAPAAPKPTMPTAPAAPKPAMPTAPTAPVMPTAPKPAMPTAPTAPVMPTAPKPAMPTATITPEVKVDITPAVNEGEGEVKEGGSRLTSTMRRHAPATASAPGVENTSKPASTSDAFMRAGDL